MELLGNIVVSIGLWLIIGLVIAVYVDAVLVQAGKSGLSNGRTVIAAVIIWPWFVVQGIRGIVHGLRDRRAR